MKRNDKKNLFKLLFGIIVIFGIMMLITVFHTPAVDANATWVDIYNWFDGIRTDVASNLGIVLGLLGLTGIGYYFLVYRPKLRK